MINRRLLSVSIALVLSGTACYAAFASQNSKKNESTQSRLDRIEAKQRKLEASMTRGSTRLAVPTPAELGYAGESPDHPAPSSYTDQSITYFGGTPVVTSPYLGLRSEFDGSDLIINLSSMNEDLRLLNQRRAFDLELRRRGKTIPEFPLIELSGKIEGLVTFEDPYASKFRNDLDLGAAELDVAGYFSKSILGFMAIKFDSFPGQFNRRVDNSRFFLDKAFLTVGDLTRTPFYASIGQMYVPYGRYSGFMITGPIPMAVGRTKARAALVGFKQEGDNAAFGEAYYFKGDTLVNRSNNGGFNLGYDFSNSKVHGTASIGMIRNMADSNFIQDGGGNEGFAGFAATSDILVHGVPGFAINGKITMGSVAVLAEYLAGTRSFDPMDLAFNGTGARPAAFDAEAAYMFNVKGHPTNVAIGYGNSKQSLALNVPKERYTVALNTSIWKDTIQSIEFRHDKNYPEGTTAFGREALAPFPTAELGKDSNMLTIQVGAYF